MKFRFLLIITVFLSFSINANAQMPMQFSTNDIFSTKNKQTFNPTAGLSVSGADNSNYFNNFSKANFSNSSFLNRLNIGCSDEDVVFGTSATGCNGVSVTPIIFENTAANPRTVVSGVDGTTGVVYRYSRAGTAPDGVVVDAIVTVSSYSNNQDATPNTFREADTTAVGFTFNLQPSIEPESDTFSTTSNSWAGSITYTIQFVVSGTNTAKRITVAATSIDNDGAPASATTCSAPLREAVIYSSNRNQTLINTIAAPGTTQIIDSNNNNRVVGPATVQSGIGIGSEYASSALYVNVDNLTWTYSFATDTTATCTAGNTTQDRFGSLNLSCQIPFNQNFAAVSLSGNVYNDTNGLTDSIVNGVGTGTPSGTQLYANLVDSNNFVVSSVAVAAGGGYTFPAAVTGNYTVQISTSQGIESSAAPAPVLPAGWVNTGEFLGTAAGNDGTPNGSLAVTVGATAIANANFGIEQRPTATNNTAASQANPGGTTSANVPSTTFSGTDPVTNTVASIRITAFPSGATSITINGTQYTAANFPAGGVTIPTNAAGNPAQTILVDPAATGATSVGIAYVAIDNAGVESSAATAQVPFALAPTAANGEISGGLYLAGQPVRNALVVLTDTSSNAKVVTRTNNDGTYLFSDKAAGRTYIVHPLSSKYAFSPSTLVVNLLDTATGQNFDASPKNYHPKNDFDGDGKTDIAVFRPTDGNWYVLQSSDDQMSVFNFGANGDVPAAADFDGDGKTDYAVFRPTDGNWYVWQSATETLRSERFGQTGDKTVPADFDGDGKADIAVYRAGYWYIRRSSDNSFEARNYGNATDTPITGDFNGDQKADFSVYRAAAATWFTLYNSTDNSSARKFGIETDVSVAEDFDGDGMTDIAQFRNGFWYILNSTTDFEAIRFGSTDDKLVVGDYDGDGRADTAIFREGLWVIRQSGNGQAKYVYFGSSTDDLVR